MPIGAHRLATRGDVLYRFRHDDDATVRGVLNDLVEAFADSLRSTKPSAKGVFRSPRRARPVSFWWPTA